MAYTNTITETVYTFIQNFVHEHGYAPSLRKIGEACYIGRSTVVRHLDKLEAIGQIERETGKARSIRLNDE